MLKVLYSFFLGLLLVVFIGMGIASFYPRPAAPEYPVALESVEGEHTERQRQAQLDYEAANRTYNNNVDNYDRNVSIIALVAAVVLVALGLLLNTKASVIADGLLLGGVFTLLYSIGRSFAGDDPKYSFMVTSAGLIVTMVVGYIKFVKPQSAQKKS